MFLSTSISSLLRQRGRSDTAAMTILIQSPSLCPYSALIIGSVPPLRRPTIRVPSTLACGTAGVDVFFFAFWVRLETRILTHYSAGGQRPYLWTTTFPPTLTTLTDNRPTLHSPSIWSGKRLCVFSFTLNLRRHCARVGCMLRRNRNHPLTKPRNLTCVHQLQPIRMKCQHPGIVPSPYLASPDPL